MPYFLVKRPSGVNWSSKFLSDNFMGNGFPAHERVMVEAGFEAGFS